MPDILCRREIQSQRSTSRPFSLNRGCDECHKCSRRDLCERQSSLLVRLPVSAERGRERCRWEGQLEEIEMLDACTPSHALSDMWMKTVEKLISRKNYWLPNRTSIST